jgi:hypothetical protein
VVTYQANRRPNGPVEVIEHPGLFNRPTIRPIKQAPWSSRSTVVLAPCTGAVDDASGTYTGVSNGLLDHAADQIFWLVGEHTNLDATELNMGSTLGSQGQAKAELGTYHKLSVFIHTREQVGQYLQRMLQESRAIPIWNTEGKWGIVVISRDPTVDYRASHNAYDFEPDRDFYPDTFKTWRTPLEELVSSVVIDFDYSPTLRTFRKSAFINPDESDNGFGTDDDSARVTLAGYAESRFGSGREYRLQAFGVRNQGVAKSLRNFYFDNLWRPRTWLEFQTGLNVTDLSVGNVIRFGVETVQGMRVPNPDAAEEHWDDYLWYISEVTRLEQEGDVSRHLVRAFEAIVPDTPADWVAAADDSAGKTPA